MTKARSRSSAGGGRAKDAKKVRLPVLADDASGLPFFAAKWVPPLVGADLPPEREATCSACVMVPPEGETFTGDGPYFSPRSRCCTFVPMVPNFSVGALLLDPDPALEDGRRRVRKRIEGRIGATPLGLGPTGHEEMTLGKVWAAFGKHHALVCPYFRTEGGACTIWRYRNSVCTTWFCKHERGAVGNAVWRATQSFLGAVERAVATHCAVSLELGDVAVERLSASGLPARELSAFDLDGGQDEPSAREAWGAWFGREAAFYEACARLAFDLDADAVRRAGGSQLELATAAVRATLRRLEDVAIPERLAVQPFEILSIGKESTRLGTYSPYDPLEVPNALLPLLPAFDGRPTRAVAAAVLKEHGVDLDDDLLRQLIDFELLAPAPRS